MSDKFNFDWFRKTEECDSLLDFWIDKIKLDWWEFTNTGWVVYIKVRALQLGYLLGLVKELESMDDHPEVDWDLDFRDKE